MQELIGVSESILTSIKKLLGPTEEYEAFDAEIMMHINSVFLTLQQMVSAPMRVFLLLIKHRYGLTLSQIKFWLML